MNILVINAGSSSLKFQLLNSGTHYSSGNNFACEYKGIVDNIGLKSCEFRANWGTKSVEKKIFVKSHLQAIKLALDFMLEQKIVASLDEIHAIGHRVVHGGEKYRQASRITGHTIAVIRKLSELAPLHNPPNLKGILACKKLLKGIPQVAVFDTAFHETIPEKAYLYALPYKLYSEHGIRRYGFHGTSHNYVAKAAAKLLKTTKSKIVTCHLGNGSSLAAILNGKSIDTTMGLTPLEGVPMGTRSGDIDPAIIFHLIREHHQKPEKVEKMLLYDSGIKGLSEIGSDVREIWAKAKKKNPHALRTLTILAYRIAKYIGAYAAALNGLDAIVFTAGIGENAYYLRQEICGYLSHLKVKINPAKNKRNAIEISDTKSKVKVFVIPTNEEKEIAIETARVINQQK